MTDKPTMREYPHETALRLKREAAEALYDALKNVRSYNNGDGKYDFSALSGYDRSNAMFDAWQDIALQIDAALSLARGETPSDTLGEKAGG